MTIDVKPTSNGWTIIQGSNKTEITDSNGNGRLDDGDLAQVISGNAISQKDMIRIANTVNGTQEVKPEQQKQSKGFWGTLGGIFNGVTSIFSGVLSSFMGFWGLGFGQDAWSRNTYGGVGFNDLKVGINSMMPGSFNMGVTNMLGSMGYNSMTPITAGGGFDFGTIMNTVNQYMEQTNSNLAALEQKTMQATIEKNYEKVETIYNTFKENPDTITPDNLQKFETAMENAKNNNKRFSEDDTMILQKINEAPLVNEELIQNSTDEKNKLPLITAKKISNLLKQYNEAADDKKVDILTEENYTTLTTILAKKSLDENDIKTINDMIK